MKKVCFVKWIIDRVDGGLKVAVNLANELSDKYEVHLVSVLVTEESFFDLKSNVRYENLSSKKLSMQKHFLKAVLLLREYIKKHDIQIVFGIGMSMNSVGIASTLGLDAVFISCDHTNSIVDIDTKVKKIQRYFGAKAADKIITLTTEDRDNYIKQYKIDSNKVECIYNWINSINNVEKYNLNSKKLVTVGRFDKQKGYDYLSKVAVNVLSKFPNWQWDIYGSGDDSIKEKLISELKEGGVVAQVNFMGNVKGIENIYPNHGVYVMTSRYEGLPLVLLEAKQYGLPIVSFNCPTGPSEIVLDGKNGYLVDNFEIDEMSEKICKLIENEELRISFSKKSMNDTEKFSKAKILKQWIHLIEEMTGGENAG